MRRVQDVETWLAEEPAERTHDVCVFVSIDNNEFCYAGTNLSIGEAAEQAALSAVAALGRIVNQAQVLVYWRDTPERPYGPFTVAIYITADAKGLRGGM